MIPCAHFFSPFQAHRDSRLALSRLSLYKTRRRNTMDPLKSGAIFKIKNIGILRGAHNTGSNGKNSSSGSQDNRESLKSGSSPEKGRAA